MPREDNNRKSVLTVLLSISLFISVTIFAQENPRNLSSAQRELSQIRGEIARLQQDLAKSKNTLQAKIDNMQNLDQQVLLYQQSLTLLQQEIRRSQRELSSLSAGIQKLAKQIKVLQDKFRQQIVFMYKYHQGKELEWILGAENFNQALLRYRYFRIITRSVERIYKRLQSKQEQLKTLKDKRTRELRQQQQLAAEKSAQQKQLLARRQERRKQIEQIKRNKQLLELALQEKQNSLARLENIIATLERERVEKTSESREKFDWESLPGNFGKQRGKLNWPVRGRVAHRFGKYRNPRLKTVLVNNGIDIKAKKGSPVRCVASGFVSVVTYMSGFGKMIIVDHDKGFYTVYAHLEEVFVQKFEKVEAGKVIATVGDSGSLEGSLLHFEIYGGNKPLNPVRWLKKL